MTAHALFEQHPLFALGRAAVAAGDTAEVSAELQGFEAAIRDYSTARTSVDWATVERCGSAVAAKRCDLKIYSYLALAAFCGGNEAPESSPFAALGAVLHALGDLIEQGWERCTPRLPARRQAQLKWLSEELALPLKTRPPRPAEGPALLFCLAEAERVAELSGNALGLGYPLLRELREALAAYKPPEPPPAAKPAPPAPSIPKPAPVAPSAVAAAPAPGTASTPVAVPEPAAVAAAVPVAESAPVVASAPALGKNPAAMSREAMEDALSELVTRLAAELRAESLIDPTAYWLLRALRWAGHELLRPERAEEVIANKYQTFLPPPPEYKLQLKQLPARLAAGQHAEVLAECEELFATYPLWLDLQRFALQALAELGGTAACQVIRTELQLLLGRCPELVRFRFGDRAATPLASADTVEWIQTELSLDPPPSAASAPKAEPSSTIPEGLEPGVRALQKAIAGAGSGKLRFELQLQLAELLLTAGRSDIAMPLVEALLAAMKMHHLSDWQPELCERALGLAVRTGRAAELEKSRRAELWTRLCQLSPATAILLGPELSSE